VLAKYENDLANYLTASRLLQTEKNLTDSKALEHKITYFCTSALQLNAISFLEIIEISRKDLFIIMPTLEKKFESGDNDEKTAKEEAVPAVEIKTDDLGNDTTLGSDIVVACEPILDPIAGVSIGDLSVGDTICCKMREDSVFYNLMSNASPDFDGVVSGEVSAVQVNDLGSAVVALKLADGVTGALRLTGMVRVKVVSRKPVATSSVGQQQSTQIFLAIAGVMIFLFVMAILLYFFS
jgi:hypothetical protein